MNSIGKVIVSLVVRYEHFILIFGFNIEEPDTAIKVSASSIVLKT